MERRNFEKETLRYKRKAARHSRAPRRAATGAGLNRFASDDLW